MILRSAMAAALALAFISPGTAITAETTTPSAAAFLESCRKPETKTWAVLSGTARHKRKGGEESSQPIRVGIRFFDERVLARIRIGAAEEYSVMQPFSERDSTVIRIDKADKALLSDFGIRPEDLTMTFLYWELVKEHPSETVKMGRCRVLGLKDPKSGEEAKVYINEEQKAPVKVEWIPVGGGEPVRSLEITSMTEAGENLYAPSGIRLFGPGWRTSVDFNDCKAGKSESAPKNLFIPQSPD